MDMLKADKARELTAYAARRQGIIDQISMELMTANCSATQTLVTADISPDYLEGEDNIMGNYLGFGKHGDYRILIAPMQPTMQIIEHLNKKIALVAEANGGVVVEKLPIPVAVLKYLEIIYRGAGYMAHMPDESNIHIAWKAQS